MRLLNVETLQLESFDDDDIPRYAALSHTWCEGEITMDDLVTDTNKEKAGWKKVCAACLKAQRWGCKYIWIDTCCIDKKSSSELSEAINSMHDWYRNCDPCLAYLEDLEHKQENFTSKKAWDLHGIAAFGASRWFTRGW
jgi:hypothetical protein